MEYKNYRKCCRFCHQPNSDEDKLSIITPQFKTFYKTAFNRELDPSEVFSSLRCESCCVFIKMTAKRISKFFESDKMVNRKVKPEPLTPQSSSTRASGIVSVPTNMKRGQKVNATVSKRRMTIAHFPEPEPLTQSSTTRASRLSFYKPCDCSSEVTVAARKRRLTVADFPESVRPGISSYMFKCVASECTREFYTMRGLNQHKSKAHKMNKQEEQSSKTFSKIDESKAYKSNFRGTMVDVPIKTRRVTFYIH